MKRHDLSLVAGALVFLLPACGAAAPAVPPAAVPNAPASTVVAKGDAAASVTPHYRVVGITDGGAFFGAVQRKGHYPREEFILGTALTITNRNDILFAAGDVYHWDGQQTVWCRRVLGAPLSDVADRVGNARVQYNPNVTTSDNFGAAQSPPQPLMRQLRRGSLRAAARLPQTAEPALPTPQMPPDPLANAPDADVVNTPYDYPNVLDMNDAGAVVGYSVSGLYSTLTGLPQWVVPSHALVNALRMDPTYGCSGYFGCINNRGQILATAQVAAGDRYESVGSSDHSSWDIARQSTSSTPEFLWQNGQITLVDTLMQNQASATGGASTKLPPPFGAAVPRVSEEVAWNGGLRSGPDEFMPRGLNDAGVLVGGIVRDSSAPGGALSAGGVWNGHMTVLHGPRGNEWTVAYSINNLGQVVGACSTRAALWENGRVYDLNALIPPNSGWLLAKGVHINDQGLIVGEGQYHGKTASFLLVPLSNAPDNIPQTDSQTAAAGTTAVGTMP